MTDNRTYSPAELCKMLNIAKTTLYRWEQEKKITIAPRDLKGERQYTTAHVKELAKIQLEVLKRQYDLASLSEDIDRMTRLIQEISRVKALYLEDPTGLSELGEYSELSDTFVRELLRKAAELDSKDAAFRQIIDLLYRTFIKK
jgi:DNA-binding transcriptional MerR regulator